VHPRRILQSALVLSLLALPVACGDDSTTAEDATTTTSASTTTTSTTVDDTSSNTDAPSDQMVVWPLTGSSVTYDDPVDAATGFATELVGFTDPIVGEFRQGDTRSGEVEVRASADGPVTTVMVRQLSGDDTWSVLAAATAAIVPTQPEAGATVTSPLELRGTSTGFEGTVQVSLLDGTDPEPLVEGFVTGGSMGEMGSFENSVEFSEPTSATGTVVMYSVSMEDGSVWEATVLPVRFG